MRPGRAHRPVSSSPAPPPAPHDRLWLIDLGPPPPADPFPPQAAGQDPALYAAARTVFERFDPAYTAYIKAKTEFDAFHKTNPERFARFRMDLGDAMEALERDDRAVKEGRQPSKQFINAGEW